MPEVKSRWPKKARCAVSLTYDDGLPSHPASLAPRLEHYHLRGTFYAPLQSDLSKDPIAWRKLAQRGHEIGNHTVFHPCWSVGGKYADWLPEQYNLVHYTAARWVDEIRTANEALFLIDGQRERTYGNTCYDNYLGDPEHPVCLEPLIAENFVAARGEETKKPVALDALNWQNLGTVWADGRAFGDFAPELDDLLDSGGWIIYTMHGVGAGTHALNIEAGEHERLLGFLHDQSERIWTAPVRDVVRHLKKGASKA
jgi:peptidoglycan/xylan/chitin deacetylase (PgdA/CDA1 family)